ncbi:Hsp20/alpha crystallin family protein [Xanthovirga aplysinae]|uniref:Hsp20/alpha crystallin family protein n=1 Tax=Xanthovirga aplysinae TaxID=2529853 RepID=UPI0012BC66C9|nr:Hsp20/alpha crystallin family protein [Xanthovirga aplysinae]MTI29288.1 Hsp20/alpha crystallin family protein [Xanthovirga aplysinae]
MRFNRNIRPLDRLFNDFFYAGLQSVPSETEFRPQTNVSELKDGFSLEIAVPGLKKEAISIDISKDVLTISGSRTVKQKEEVKFHTNEIPSGNFKRSFILPEIVNQEKIKANYEEGILTIFLPKNPNNVEKKQIVVA